MDKSLALIAGLGNPGKKYENTRHNFGFDAVDRFAHLAGTAFSTEKKFNAELAKATSGDRKVILVKPLSYMNLSGPVVRKIVDFYQIPVSEVLVVLDDANIPFGTIRMRMGGSDGGHHGLESVSRSLGSREHPRQRLGIGRGDNLRQIAGFVLDKFRSEDQDLKELVERKAVDQMISWLQDGPEIAVQQFNGAV